MSGVRISSGMLVTGTTAARKRVESSLQVGEIIHAMNGDALSSVADLLGMLAMLSPGDAVVMTAERQQMLRV